MLAGVRFLAHPTDSQKQTLSQWMGCSKVVWNAKCEEAKYLNSFARKYLPIGTYAPINQAYSQYKTKELTPYLADCPSQILRNSSTNWYQTYQNFMKGICGKPKRKRFDHKASIHLTKEVFSFEVCKDGVTRLFIGTKTNNLGSLSFQETPFLQDSKVTLY
jgi:putative transposase